MPSPARLLHDRRAKPRVATGYFSSEATLSWHAALRRHWPEYLIEAFLLAAFITCAGVVMTLLEGSGAGGRDGVSIPLSSRLLTGLAMGLVATALIYSPWGRRSGAHMNPAITLAFFRLNKVGRWDLLFYVIAQFAGGLAGILFVRATMGPAFAAAPVSWGATVPGTAGEIVAFLAEVVVAAVLMLAVIYSSNHATLHRWTGAICGLLIAAFFVVEAPLSGFGMNPARTFASALPSGIWTGAWLYFVAPILGMQLAVDAYRALTGRQAVLCAKLAHNVTGRCIFRCQHPYQARANALEEIDRQLHLHGS